MIFELVKEDVALFFEGATGKVRRVWSPRSNRQFWLFDEDPRTLYIMDAGGNGIHREPLFVNAFTVVTASPNEKHYGQFVKEIGLSSRVFLPDWTLEDLLAVLPFVDERGENQVDTDPIVEERFNIIGGIPRYVFGSKADFDDSFAALRVGLADISTFDFRRLMAKEKRWQEVPNFVFTLRSRPPNYDDASTSAVMASQYVKEQLPLQLNENNFHQLVSLSTSYESLSSSLFSTTRGHCWQLACLYRLIHGGSVQLRSISQNLPARVIPARAMGSLKYKGKRKDEVVIGDARDGVLYWSEQMNFPGIEGFTFDHGDVVVMFQCTVSASRELDLGRVTNVLQAISQNGRRISLVQLWYLVPPNVFTTFTVSNQTLLPPSIPLGGQDMAFDVVVGTFGDLEPR